MRKTFLILFLIFGLLSCEGVKNSKNLENIPKTNLKKQIIKKGFKDYYEISLDININSDEFQNNVFILEEKFKEKIKKIYSGELKNFDEFKKLKKLDLDCGKYFEKCPNGKFGFTKNELKKLFNGVFTEFYRDNNDNIYVFNKDFVLKNNEEIINFKNRNIKIFEGANGAFANIGVYDDKLGFDFLYSDVGNNIEYNKLNCEEVIKKAENFLKDCENKAILEKDNQKINQCYEVQEKDKIYNRCIDIIYDYKNIKRNIFFDSDLFNKKYHLDSSKKIFTYNGKIGFIAEKNHKKFIMFDGKQITKEFDDIKTQSCCMSLPYPFYVLKNGLLAFVFERNKKFYIGYVYLEGKENYDFLTKIDKKISSVMSINFDINFLKEPKKLEKLGFLKNQTIDSEPMDLFYEDTVDYFKVADLKFEKGNGELILVATNNYRIGDKIFYFVKYEDKYYFLPSISSGWDYGNENKILKLEKLKERFKKLDIDFYSENRFKKILDLYKIPKKIDFVKDGKNYKLKLIGKTPYFLTNYILKNLEKITFIKQKNNLYIEKNLNNKIWGNVEFRKLEKLQLNDYKNFEKLDEKTKNNFYKQKEKIKFFKSDAIFMKMPDNSVAFYNLEIPFEKKGNNYNNKIILDINGNIKEISHYSYKETSSCGLRNGTYMYISNGFYQFDPYRIAIGNKKSYDYVDKIKKKDTIFTYKNSDFKKNGDFLRNDGKKENAYILDKNTSFMKAMYKYGYYAQLDDFGCLDEKGDFKKNDEECNYQNFLTYNDFINTFPLLFWKDPFGRYILFLSWNVSQPSACGAKPVIYLYPEKKQKIQVKLNWYKKNLFTIPIYKNSWEVISDKNSNIFDLKTKKYYPYLFWEDLLTYKNNNKGFVIKKENLEKFFDDKLSYVNLNKKEIADFKKYWLPKMQENQYYFINFLQTEKLNRIVPIKITPTPDNIGRIFMDYRGLTKYKKVEPQKLKKFNRNGFYVIEWGGVKK